MYQQHIVPPIFIIHNKKNNYNRKNIDKITNNITKIVESTVFHDVHISFSTSQHVHINSFPQSYTHYPQNISRIIHILATKALWISLIIIIHNSV